MIKTIKVMLKPNNKQKSKMFQNSGAARFAYNWALNEQQENYKNGGKFLSDSELRKRFTKLKHQEKYLWLNDYSNDITKQSIKDCCTAYKRFFNGVSKYPKFKSKKKSKKSFYIDTYKIKFTETHVKLEKISSSTRKNRTKLNWIKLCEKNRIPTNYKYYNPRVSFDGLNWYLTVGIEYEDCTGIPENDGIGIDLGVKDLAICSDGNVYSNTNKTNKIQKIQKKKRRLQRKLNKKYIKNKKGECYKKTSNIKKLEKKVLKANRRLTNIRNNYLHQVTTEVIKREPKFIAVENLNVSGMLKNRKLSKAIQEVSFYEFKRQLEYKCSWSNIKLITIDRFYPSSKTCSECGNIKQDLKLSDRNYICDNCGLIIDRDLNASINIKKQGMLQIA